MSLPGHMDWHGPLAMLSAGVWPSVAAPGLAILPAGRLRTVTTVAVLGMTALLGILVIRALCALLAADGGATAGGWIHLSPWLHGCALILAAAAAHLRWQPGPRPAAVAGAVILDLLWAWPVAVMMAIPESRHPVRMGCLLVLVLGMAWTPVPPWMDQLAGAVVLAWAAPAWRPVALAMAVAGGCP